MIRLPLVSLLLLLPPNFARPAAAAAPGVDPNLVGNPEFDGGDQGWSVDPEVAWQQEDHNTCSGSGSVRMSPTFATLVGLERDIPLPAGVSIVAFGGFWRFPTFPPPDLGGPATEAYIWVQRLAGPGCTNPAGPPQFISVDPSANGDTWVRHTRVIGVSGTACLSFQVAWLWNGDAIAEFADFDGAFVIPVDHLEAEPIFLDGFETSGGSLCRWSGGVPSADSSAPTARAQRNPNRV